MRSLNQIILLLIVSASFISCKKKGCTDCNAINYDINAEKDDNSCLFLNEDVLGVYAVSDSITGPPSLDWNHSFYDIEIKRVECSPNHLIISNYANKNNNFSGVIYNIECEVSNEVISILEQEVQGDNVNSNLGYFSNDSIHFDIGFINEFGEAFYGKCFGKKK